MVSMSSPGGGALDATGLQLQGLLDATLTYDGPLGYHKLPGDSGARAVTLWAPTAQSVELMQWDGPQGGSAKVQAMTPGPQGTWSLPVPDTWYSTYYKYRCGASWCQGPGVSAAAAGAC